MTKEGITKEIIFREVESVDLFRPGVHIIGEYRLPCGTPIRAIQTVRAGNLPLTASARLFIKAELARMIIAECEPDSSFATEPSLNPFKVDPLTKEEIYI